MCETIVLPHLALAHSNRAWRKRWRSPPKARLAHAISMDHFFLPLLLNGLQQVGSDLAHPALKGADLQGVIASWGEAL
jgi:hypothetical protein